MGITEALSKNSEDLQKEVSTEDHTQRSSGSKLSAYLNSPVLKGRVSTIMSSPNEFSRRGGNYKDPQQIIMRKKIGMDPAKHQ